MREARAGREKVAVGCSQSTVLVLHLKRFEMLGYHSAKLETPVAVPSNIPIDIGKYVGAPQSEGMNCPQRDTIYVRS